LGQRNGHTEGREEQGVNIASAHDWEEQRGRGRRGREGRESGVEHRHGAQGRDHHTGKTTQEGGIWVLINVWMFTMCVYVHREWLEVSRTFIWCEYVGV
jgi:hypothetical protein